MEEHSNYNITVYKYVVSIHSLNKQDAQKNKILYSDHKHKRDGVENCYVGIIGGGPFCVAWYCISGLWRCRTDVINWPQKYG